MTRFRRLTVQARTGLAVVFAAMLPAEVVHPLVRVGPLDVTNLELLAYLLITAHGAALLAGAPGMRLHRAGVMGLALFFVGAVASTAFALYDPVTSAKTVLRFGAALLVGHAVAHVVIGSRRAWAAIAVAFLVGTSASAALGTLEFMTGGNVGEYVTLFRDAHLTVGGFAVRATGTLLHPNVAGWLWGVAGVAATIGLISARSSALSLLSGCAAAVLFLGLVLSLSRGALVGTIVASAVAAALVARQSRSWRRAVLLLVPVPIVVATAAAASPVVTARLLSETEQEWYRFAVTAPKSVVIDRPEITIPIEVTNVTPVHWHHRGVGAVQVSYHLKNAQGDYVEYEGQRTPLPESLEPGETVTVAADVLAVGESDTLAIEWDLIQEGRTWFSERFASAKSETRAIVAVTDDDTASPSDRGRGPTETEQDLLESRSFGRSTLWPVAVDMFAARPMTGIGLDNFRLGYGEWLGLSNWDEDINANNLYLELLASVGVWTFGLLLAGAVSVARLVRAAPTASDPAACALVVLSATAVHGVFDSFLTYSAPAYIVSWALVLGLLQTVPRR